ncbi:uncharacterized protein LOC131955150 [Physella acuta]|uniref:uncharacterized protein LOC131955150 n=1 Tax=Physella acuta TaxID=109671 RepID=UPI0027DE330D|nr:uncharacterized protein LOC131955150 [Physella acuta]
MDKQEVCFQIVQSLENVWSENILFDFAVKVQDETIQCHRLILAACSEFFKALFRSGMKEVTENCVVLKDVSCEVFRLIINTMYTGTSLLTLDNFIEVWQAAHMLQVKVMVNVCEEFAIRLCSLDTWENIYLHAKLFCSVKVLDKLHTFMIKNFEEIRQSTTFLQLSFKEVQDLIKSQDLVVSKEDLVLESVIQWVEYVDGNQLNHNLNEDHNHTISCNDVKTDISLSIDEAKEIKESEDGLHRNNCLQNSNKTEITAVQEVTTTHSTNTVKSSRKVKLKELLMEVRTCLVSHAALYRVLKLRLFSEDENSRELILNGMSHHVQEFRHGQWSSSALHRSCSGYINAGVNAYGGGIFEIITADKEQQFNITKCRYLKENIQLVTFDGELYATGKEVGNSPGRMFVFCGKNWKEVMEMPSHNLLLVSHGDFIYIINKDDKVLYNINPKEREPNLEKITDFLSNDTEVNYAMVLENLFLLFCSESVNGIEKTAVHKYEMLSKVWTRLDNLDGPSEQLISFKNDKHNYILQTNGSLWLLEKLSGNGSIEFKFLDKLWNFRKKLYGALTFQSKLIILGNNPNNDPHNEKQLPLLSEHFTEISHWENDFCSSNFIPITIRKNDLVPIKKV